jgi:hypothetical protein
MVAIPKMILKKKSEKKRGKSIMKNWADGMYSANLTPFYPVKQSISNLLFKNRRAWATFFPHTLDSHQIFVTYIFSLTL